MTVQPDDLADVFHVPRDEAYLRQAKEEAAYYDQLLLVRQFSAAGTLTPTSRFAVYRMRVQT